MFPPYQSGALNHWTTGLKSGCRLEAIGRKQTPDIAAILPVSCLLSPACLLTRVGFEPNLSSLKGWQPHQKSNGPCCARTGCAKWVERCLNPRLQIFSPPLIRLSYRPMIGEDIAARTKKARCRCDTGLGSLSPNTAKRHKRRIWVDSAVSLRKRAD